MKYPQYTVFSDRTNACPSYCVGSVNIPFHNYYVQERVHQDPVTDVTELQQQLHLRSQQLGRKEAELTRAEETIRREQQQIHEMVILMTCSWILRYLCLYIIQRETITREQQLVQAKDRELVQAQQQLRQQVIFIT